MEKLLVTYNEVGVVLVTTYYEGTAILTPHRFIVDTKENAVTLLSGLGIDLTVLLEYSQNPIK